MTCGREIGAPANRLVPQAKLSGTGSPVGLATELELVTSVDSW